MAAAQSFCQLLWARTLPTLPSGHHTHPLPAPYQCPTARHGIATLGYSALPAQTLAVDGNHVPHWITLPSELTDRLKASRPSRIGLDTEFIRERTYWPQLALVQMAIGEEILLIDPLIPGMNEALKQWLAATDIVKVMHSASEDLITFKCACGVLPRPLFDTQIAAALAGFGGGIGYRNLVQEVTGILLTKGETRSDWMRRPLSPSQLDYASDDVRYLFAIHDQLTRRLTEQARLGWLAEDAERLLAIVEHDDSERWPHVSLRTAQFLEPAAQRRLLRLLRWRDLQARQSNRPRSWILDNELASQLARFPPSDLDALLVQFNKVPKAPRKLANAVWDALNTPLADEAQAPLAQAATDGNKAVLKRLRDTVARRSRELGLPDGLLASRRHLETLIEQRSWPTALGQWRREVLEAQLMALLENTSS